NDFVKPNKVYRAANDQERAALEDLVASLKSADVALAQIAKKNAAEESDNPLPDADFTNEDFLQSIVFAIGKNHGFDPLRDWFKAIYEVLLGASQGPRFGGFIALYGVKDSIELIEKGLAGELG
ncbi:MAG: lysine--tRNA ligase, partial [Paracoccaceae bacterium]|nr:lysine--tRNA ligase [Paracoccaceae bacterium]